MPAELPVSTITEVTHHMALLPLLWLGLLAYYGQRRGPLWWALALVFTVSWVADTLAHWIDPWVISAFYPLAQVLVFAVVVLPTPALGRLIVMLGIITGLVRLAGAPDMLIRTASWSGLCYLAWPRKELRLPVVTGFALGWLGWIWYTLSPGWLSWGIYQSIRALSLGSFCWVSAPQRARV